MFKKIIIILNLYLEENIENENDKDKDKCI